jgi:glycosyltransferase involved in cell wall biosynthesis
MRVVYLNPSGQLGGAEIALLDLLSSIRAAQPEWQLDLIAGDDGPLIERARGLGVNADVLHFPQSVARLGDAGQNKNGASRASRANLVTRLFAAGSPALQYVGKLRTELSRRSPHVIHTNGFKMHVLGLRARPNKATPVVWHVRDYVSPRPVMARLLRWHAGRCAAAITNSRSVADDLRRVCGDALKIYPVHDAIDLERFSPAGPKLDLDSLADLPVAENGTVRVGLLGTMALWKGHKTFLHALSLLPNDSNVRGFVIGGALYQTEGSQHSLDELKAEAARLGISHRVGFTGFIEDSASAMRSLDVVVHASTQPEPFGLVIAESMACGRALIASQAGGAAEITNAGVDSVAHNPGDAAMLAERIASLASDPERRERLGRSGRIAAEDRFDRARLATEVTPVYFEVMSAQK